MKKTPLVILLLFSALIVFVKKRQVCFAITNETTKANTHLEVSRLNACTIIVYFNDGSKPCQNIVNKGTDVITVMVKKAAPLVVFTNKFIKAEGNPACDIYDNAKNLVGHIDIKITMTLCGGIEHKEVFKDFQNIITQQITKQIII